MMMSYADAVEEFGSGLANMMLESEYNVTNIDIVDRGYNKNFKQADFLKIDTPFDGDILTNPPYKFLYGR